MRRQLHQCDLIDVACKGLFKFTTDTSDGITTVTPQEYMHITQVAMITMY